MVYYIARNGTVEEIPQNAVRLLLQLQLLTVIKIYDKLDHHDDQICFVAYDKHWKSPTLDQYNYRSAM